MAFAFPNSHNPNNDWATKTQQLNNLRNNQMQTKMTRSNIAQELASKTNGRVNILNNIPEPRFQLYDGQKHIKNDYGSEAIKGIHGDTDINNVYFSQNNIESLQKMIRYNIWLISEKKFVIDRQSDSELRIIMRSIYLQYCQHQPDKIREQVAYLNKLVLDYCLPKIYSEIKQYYMYKESVSGLPRPIERSINMSVKGSKTLEIKNFF